MKKVLLIVYFVLVGVYCNAQWQSTYRKVCPPKYNPLYKTTVIDGITYMVIDLDGSTYCAHAIDTVKKQSHVDIPSSVIIDGNTYPVKKIVFKYENHKSIRLPSTIRWVYIISSKMKYPSEYPQWYYDKSDRKIDNSNREPLFIEATGEKPPFIDEPIPMYWGSIKRLVSNPENVVLIVPRQSVETYKKSEQWEGAQVFSSKEEYYSYREEKDRQEAKVKAERVEQARIEREKAQQEKEARELQARLEKERREAEQEEMYNAFVGTWREKTVKKRKKKSRDEVYVVITRNHLTIKCDKWKPWEGYDGPFSMWVENGEWRFNPSKWSYEEIIEEKKSRGYWDNNPTYSYHRVNYKCSLELGEDNTLWLIRNYWRIQLVKDTE